MLRDKNVMFTFTDRIAREAIFQMQYDLMILRNRDLRSQISNMSILC
jgi:hypothetical protein